MVELIGITVTLIDAGYSAMRFALVPAGKGAAAGGAAAGGRARVGMEAGGDAYKTLRSNLWRSILLGL